jgi:decaprenylphospho-beta-D-ribofuranose 2-oxidase
MKIVQSGWGRTSKSKNEVFNVRDFKSEIVNTAKNGLAIGLGRSYGDSSITSDGIYFSTNLNRKITVDKENITAICESGATIGDLEREALAVGLFPPVVPGTEFVTIGGAIASNIHGKSHHTMGSFSNCVAEIKLLTSQGEILNLKPENENHELFWATLGGMGLTGIILEATIKLINVETSYVLVEEKRARNIEEIFDLLSEFDNRFLYTVAWIDLSGSYKGRGRVAGGNHATYSELPSKLKKNSLKINQPKKFQLPNIFPSKTINRFTVLLFNKLWFHKPLSNGYLNVRPFMHPLDSVKDWNRIYGKNGFYQFQFSIPFGSEKFIKSILMELKEFKMASFLGVVKKFGQSDKSLLGFPSPGWTIAIDIPADHPEVRKWLQQKYEELAKIGGKIYLTKDATLDSQSFNYMYPKSNEWRKIKLKIDPYNFWVSDQSKRIGLC